MPRALLSVSDKTGLEAFARELLALDFELIASGGTRFFLGALGLPVTPVDAVTGYPELLGGRVKTLHPVLHAGILASREEDHLAELERHGAGPIDVVAVNLYSLADSWHVGAPSVDDVSAIDIGGPALLRAAAKNYFHVLPLCDPNDYPRAISGLSQGMDLVERAAFARKAFAHTSAYDADIVRRFDGDTLFPATMVLHLQHAEPLRYGENPHQQGARYRFSGRQGWIDRSVQHAGPVLSYLNHYDAETAWRLVSELPAKSAAVIVKHASPCGAAVADDVKVAYEQAFDADPKSAFGGVVAIRGVVTAELARAIRDKPKADLVVATGYHPEAIDIMTAGRKNLRLLEGAPPGPKTLELRGIDGGLLVQEPDNAGVRSGDWRVVTRRQPDAREWLDIELAWRVCAYAVSNAVVLARHGQTVGIGAGQQSRVDACEIAADKAAGRAQGAVCASDAFFPFRDGLDVVHAAGATAVIQPGGSVRDEELIAAADEHDMAMVFAGKRHFRH